MMRSPPSTASQTIRFIRIDAAPPANPQGAFGMFPFADPGMPAAEDVFGQLMDPPDGFRIAAPPGKAKGLSGFPKAGPFLPSPLLPSSSPKRKAQE